MGNKKKATKKTRKNVKDSEVEYVGTIELEQQYLEDTEHQSEQLQNDADKETQPLQDDEQPKNPDAETADHEEGVNDNQVDDNESEVPAANNEHETHQPKRKKQRGPTRMKHIAKEPNPREKVEYNEMGEDVGSGSVKLSSYVGCLVREHIPVIFPDWRLVNEELKIVLWKFIQARFELDEDT